MTIAKDFAGGVAVVTGGGAGLGEAMAIAFAGAGMRVVVVDIAQDRAESLGEKLRSKGLEAMGLQCDVSSRESVNELARRVHETWGGVKLLCNNAGIGGGRTGTFLEMATSDEWEKVIDVNLWGVVHCLQSFLPLMVASGERAHIVNTASMAAFLPSPRSGPYTTSKFAVVGLSEALAEELPPHVGISILCPGPFATGIWGGETKGSGGFKLSDPATIGPIVLAGIEANAPYIFTHPAFADVVEQRYQRILDQLRNSSSH